MSDERKIVKASWTAGENPYGFGQVRGEFEAERFPGKPLLDTRVELQISPFTITWEKRTELVEEIAALIAKYQI
jgi:hypothetical protein